MASNPVETYLRQMAETRATGGGVDELSYYTPLNVLLDAVGSELKPKVRCVMQLKNLGAGNPDGGLFTRDQFDRKSGKPRNPQLPNRGAIEAKPVADDAWLTAEGTQVTKYWGKYGLVLVTNYRDFVMVGKDRDGLACKLEDFHLADSEDGFWALAAKPRAAGHRVGQEFLEFLRRCMLHETPLSTPQDLARFLASYARAALARVEDAELASLHSLRTALEESLEMKFEGEKGEHFFRSTLVQTLFYGIFSAWVLWARGRSASDPARFNWKETVYLLRVPVIQSLYGRLSQPSHLEPLGLIQVLDWAEGALNHVDRGSFFEAFEGGQVVQHFYEPFLQEFDPQLRKNLGVWYTPPEIVRYMVERVDRVLRTGLGVADGLADPSVYVLDPAAGTGSYLVEVLRRIERTLHDKGGDALVVQDVKKAAIERVFGFEILPAPYVVAHLQMGLYLQSIEAPLSDAEGERAGVYLTNALTGWEPLDPKKEKVLAPVKAAFPELLAEMDDASRVKRDEPILVVIGNPPYNAFDGTSPPPELGLVDPYKEGLVKKWGIKKFNLDDLYVRFFRLAERRIAEQTGRGVICYISNFSYLGDPSFVVMRERLLDGFDDLWFDNMNGDSRETGKRTPDGRPDPSVFSTRSNTAGIRVGTAIGLLVRKKKDGSAHARVRYRQFWGTAKRDDLVATVSKTGAEFEASYGDAVPTSANRFSFKPIKVAEDYSSWPAIKDLCAIPPINGLMEKRRGDLISDDRQTLETRMSAYFSEEVPWPELERLAPGLTSPAARFEPRSTRNKVRNRDLFAVDRIRRYALRPFDTRWAYYSGVRPLWNEPRPGLWAQAREPNEFILSRRRPSSDREGAPFYYTRLLSDDHLLMPDASAFAFALRGIHGEKSNLSGPVREYLFALGLLEADVGDERASAVWLHALAAGYSPAYLVENADGIRQDWPRVPLPDSKEALTASAALGRQLADLLDTENGVDGVTQRTIRSELRVLARVTSVSGKTLGLGNLRLEAGWGHFGQGGAVMPGAGKTVVREWAPSDRTAIAEGAATLGLDADAAFAQLSDECVDVFLNDHAYWKAIPRAVWEYRIGGYQVIKKWLSYREHKVLGRSLSIDEARYVTEMTRRLTAIVLLQPALDESYRRAKNNAYKWPTAL